jgi:RNA 2',3'-cyclic 3'-phosphodiesterase
VSPDRARLFVGLDLPDIARSALVQWRTRHLSDMAGARLRLIEPEALHVTLCFLGGQAVADIDPIAVACQTAASRPAVQLSLGAPVWLPARRPRAIAVKLVDARDGLSGLQHAISHTLQAGGWYEPEHRPFLPHVTMARVGKNERVRPSELSSPPPCAAVCSAISLYRSHLGPGGARYEALHTVQLTHPEDTR